MIRDGKINGDESANGASRGDAMGDHTVREALQVLKRVARDGLTHPKGETDGRSDGRGVTSAREA